MFHIDRLESRARLLTLTGLLTTTLFANLALSMSYASLIDALATREGAATRTALLLNMWACALIFCSHRYPALLQRFGTRRCASAALLLSAIAIAVLALTDQFALWLLAEALQGVAFGLFYVAAETWVNGTYAESVRNRINSLYLAVQALGFAGGPLVVGSGHFALSTCFAAAAAAMIAATIVAALVLPDDRDGHAKASAVTIRQFFAVARQLPWVVMLGVLTGALDAAAWSLLTPYLRTAGFPDSIALFALSIFVWGQVMLLVPLGYLADHAGERLLLRVLSAFIVLYCLALTQAAELGSTLVLALTFLFGPACFSIYGAALSLAGKQVERGLLAMASASLVTGWCLGGFLGAIAIGLGMDLLDANVFPLALLTIAGGIAAVVTLSIPKTGLQHPLPLPDTSAQRQTNAEASGSACTGAHRHATLDVRRQRSSSAAIERGSYQGGTRSPARSRPTTEKGAKTGQS